ncbi:MAG TPA: ATP-grasp domain-containing protein, partial [Planctomycetes bacterium]|nr:ATP-grasp domain-containing protein [Planctomycetota bacterium]
MAGKRTIRRVLIANRGEIAVRIARTLREMGVAAIGVASDPDLSALHALVCDQVVPLGGTTPLETYLDQEKVLAAAKETGADAIHPGYGFLAENASFAKAVEEAGLVWIGPPPESIALMGDKLAAREAVARAGVPVIPGSPALSDPARARAEAEKIGYPVMLKASAGGGGKGMRVVRTPEELEPSLEAARRESGKAFGDDTIYLEKFIERPRHIEFQVLADK